MKRKPCILDGEMVLFDKRADIFLPFGAKPLATRSPLRSASMLPPPPPRAAQAPSPRT